MSTSDPDRWPDRPVVLVGLMGAGKTSAARRIADQLGRTLRDSDQDLMARYGLTAAEQVTRDGVAALHEREARHVREALAERPPPVIAAAASVVDDPTARAALASSFVVWLHAPTWVLAQRMRDGAHRPHLDADLPRMLAAQQQRRERWFRAVADLSVDVSVTTPEEVARRVLSAFQVAGHC